MPTILVRLRALAAAAALAGASFNLAGCGGGDAVPEPAVRFFVSAASPAQHAGELAAAREPDTRTRLQPPDGFSAVPYCLVQFGRLQHLARSGDYVMNLAFTPGDGRVLAVTLAQRDSSWWVAAFNPPATGARVDLGTRRLTLSGLRSTQGLQVGWEATLDGHGTFPSATDTSTCG